MKVVILGKGIMLSSMIEGGMNAPNINIEGIFRYENLIQNRWQLAISDFFTHNIEKTLINKFKLRDLHFKSANCAKFKKFLTDNGIDLILIGTWKEKILPTIYTIPRIGTVNIHPSLLPKYRGPNPYLQVIKNREPFSGFTFHKVDENFDTGDILYQKRIDIPSFYTSKELREFTANEVKKALPEFLSELEQGNVTPLKQDETLASYYTDITPDDMMLDFENETAEEIVARIKALHPWLPCYITVENEFYIPNPYKLSIEDTEPIYDIKNKLIKARCKDGRVVVMKDIEKYRKFL